MKIAVTGKGGVGKTTFAATLARLYADDVAKELEKTGNKVFTYVFKAGEENKNLNTVEDVYEFLIQNHFDRKDMLVALGGGVVGDLTGFGAATYLRGIDFIQDIQNKTSYLTKYS